MTVATLQWTDEARRAAHVTLPNMTNSPIGLAAQRQIQSVFRQHFRLLLDSAPDVLADPKAFLDDLNRLIDADAPAVQTRLLAILLAIKAAMRWTIGVDRRKEFAEAKRDERIEYRPLSVEAIKRSALRVGYQRVVAAAVALRGSPEQLLEKTARLLPASDIIAATSWAKQYSATLVRDVNAATSRTIADIVGKGIEARKDVVEIARDIRAEFQDMSVRRARLIANTETNMALSRTAHDEAKATGLEMKSWIVSPLSHNPCEEICLANEAEGPIPIEQTFQSGHEMTPGHPGCQCGIGYEAKD